MDLGQTGRNDGLNPQVLAMRYVEDFAIEERTKMARSQAALYQSLQRSHIGVAPYLEMQYNYFEPVKILDYQMAGLPVVASAVGEVPSMVDDGESGMLVPPGDVGALSSALAKLALDPQMRGEMGRAARRRARRIVETAREVTAVCNELVRAP